MLNNKPKILIDIGHPAHVHYFRNFIKIMEEKGYQFLIIARNKEITHDLLNKYNIPFIDRGKGKNGLFGKAMYYFKAIWFIYLKARGFTPDIIISFASPYAALVSKLINRPHIVFNDTEHAKLSHFLTDSFSKWILTPSCYKKALGGKQLRFNGYMELCYLHSKYFTPDVSILETLGIEKNEKYVVLRFISWQASHDVGHKGLSLDMKKKAVKELSKYAKVFISSESELPQDLKPFQLRIASEKIHDVLYYAALYFGESGTMATESALLGTPTVRVSTLAKLLGNYQELQNKYKILSFYDSEDQGFDMALKLIQDDQAKTQWQLKRNELLDDKIDVTAFMVWLIKKYPESVDLLYKEQTINSNSNELKE